MISIIKEFAPFLIYSIGVIAMFLAVMGKIDIGLLFVIPLFPLRNVYESLFVFPLGGELVAFMIYAMFLGWIGRSIIRKEQLFVPSIFNKLMIVSVIYICISFFYGSIKWGLLACPEINEVRVQLLKNYLIFSLVFFITLNNIKTIQQIKRTITVMFITMIPMAYYSILEIIWSSGIASRDKFSGTFVYLGPNEIAAFFVAYSCIVFGIFMFESEFKKKILLVSILLGSLFCILFMFSRGAYIAALSAAIFFIFMRKKIFILPLILFMFFWQNILPLQVVERINETESYDGSLDESSQIRLELWKESIEIFKQSPITGVGYGMLSVKGLSGGFQDTHNIYLRILAEQGVIGVLLFVLLLFYSFRSGIKLYNNSRDNPYLKGLGLGFSACVISMAVVNIFGNRWMHLEVGAFFWVLLGLVNRALYLIMRKV